MSKTIAYAATGVAAAFVLGTVAMIQLKNVSLADCGATAVAGETIGGPFTLLNGQGQLVTERDVITEPSLVYFGYTFCPDVCPLDVARNVTAVDILDERGISVTPVFISIDPARDTPDIVADYAANFHPRMIGLTGSDEQVAAASQAYRTYYAKSGDDPDYYLMNHSTFTYLVLPDHGFVEFFRQSESPEAMADRVACFAAVA